MGLVRFPIGRRSRGGRAKGSLCCPDHVSSVPELYARLHGRRCPPSAIHGAMPIHVAGWQRGASVLQAESRHSGLGRVEITAAPGPVVLCLPGLRPTFPCSRGRTGGADRWSYTDGAEQDIRVLVTPGLRSSLAAMCGHVRAARVACVRAVRVSAATLIDRMGRTPGACSRSSPGRVRAPLRKRVAATRDSARQAASGRAVHWAAACGRNWSSPNLYATV